MSRHLFSPAGPLAVALLLLPLASPFSSRAADAAPVAAPATQPATQSAAPVDLGPLVVHEWGTFTHFAGADGVTLEFRTKPADDLPPFVLDRPRQAELFDARLAGAKRMALFGKNTVAGYMRMETPVIYFYATKARAVEVSVDFPQGLLTEFYPPVRQMGPDYKPGRKEPMVGSWLRWGKVMLLPESALWAQAEAARKAGGKPEAAQPTAVEESAGGVASHYAYARETDAALLRLTDYPVGRTHYEKFLFYRGVGNFELPLKVASQPGGRFRVQNAGKDAISTGFLVKIQDGNVSFVELKQLGKETDALLPTEDVGGGAGGGGLDALAGAMERALVADGLYEKEAAAMVKTWRSNWFGEEGVRLLYLVPRALTDQVLPLHVAPAPDRTVRVLVGRLELMTPEIESRLARWVGRLGAESFRDRSDATKALAELGRFAEPALQRLAKSSPDAEVRARAEELLGKLQK